MKTYVITLSRKFPKGHRKEGEPTFFKEKFMFGQQCQFCPPKDMNTNYPECDECLMKCSPEKYHTIRANYELWAKRFEEVERGEACISVREWTDKPYRSPQVEIARLTKEHGIGLQKLTFRRVEEITSRTFVTGVPALLGYSPCFDARNLASNDGLDFEDWRSWFASYDCSKPMAIIHFTKFRYGS